MAQTTTIHYGPDPEEVLTLYAPLANPADPFPRPLAMFFHGGFAGGSRTQISPELLQAMQEQGFVVASVDFRLSQPFPAAMNDGKMALQVMREQAAYYQIDPNRVVLMGLSFGGAIAQWIAFHSDMANASAPSAWQHQSTRVSAVIGLLAQTTYTPRDYDELFSAINYPPFLTTLFNVTTDQLDDPARQAAFDLASPLYFFTADDPPTYLLYYSMGVVGTDWASYLHNVRMADPLLDAGFGHVVVRIYDGTEALSTMRQIAAWAREKTG